MSANSVTESLVSAKLGSLGKARGLGNGEVFRCTIRDCGKTCIARLAYSWIASSWVTLSELSIAGVLETSNEQSFLDLGNPDFVELEPTVQPDQWSSDAYSRIRQMVLVSSATAAFCWALHGVGFLRSLRALRAIALASLACGLLLLALFVNTANGKW